MVNLLVGISKAKEHLVSPKRQMFILCGWVVGLKHLISLHLLVGTRTCGMTILMPENNLKHSKRSGGFWRDGEHGESPT